MGSHESQAWTNSDKMDQISAGKEHLGTQLLFGLDADRAAVKGTMTPNDKDESIQLKAQISPSSDDARQQQMSLEGTINKDGANIKMYDSSHKMLEEINCDLSSCKRTGANGELLGTKKFEYEKATVSDVNKNEKIELSDGFLFAHNSAGPILNKSNEQVGTASMNTRAELANLPKLFVGADRKFHQAGEYKNDANHEEKSFNVTYTHNSNNDVKFEGSFERKRAAK